MNLFISAARQEAPGSQIVEVVERKGLGHPDTICDGIAEHISVRLCRYYLDRFGIILHHNVDKVLLCGGAAHPAFGGGEVLEPIEIYLAGRATEAYGGTHIPVRDIAIEACREWVRAHLRNLDADRDVRIISRLRKGSTDLMRLYARGDGRALANDTSCGAGFAPLTDLEKVVLAVERGLNNGVTRKTHPEIGEDIKVMGVRHEGRIELTIGCAFVGRFVSNIADYAKKKTAAADLAVAVARGNTTLPVEATVNAADDLERGEVFLTVTGTSAEAGDDGEVGRGNRVCGLITPYRVMTLEAAAGKNPVSHVGKLYNLAAARIASAIAGRLPSVRDVACVLLSEIGHPVDEPRVVDVALGDASTLSASRSTVTDIVQWQLGQMSALRDELLSERVTVY
jgi:S-adenosylmethionine synthetase